MVFSKLSVALNSQLKHDMMIHCRISSPAVYTHSRTRFSNPLFSCLAKVIPILSKTDQLLVLLSWEINNSARCV